MMQHFLFFLLLRSAILRYSQCRRIHVEKPGRVLLSDGQKISSKKLQFLSKNLIFELANSYLILKEPLKVKSSLQMSNYRIL